MDKRDNRVPVVDFDHETRENGRRVPEVLLDMRALELTGRTCDELFQGWTGTARISDRLSPEVRELAQNYLNELRYQASIAELVEAGQFPGEQSAAGAAPMLAPIKTVGGAVLATSSYPRGLLAKIREQSPNFGRETIGGCNC